LPITANPYITVSHIFSSYFLFYQFYNHSRENRSVYIKQNGVASNFSDGESWTVLSPIEQRIKAKIEAVGVPLRDWDIKINRGMQKDNGSC